jgi:hypothetical protein
MDEIETIVRPCRQLRVEVSREAEGVPPLLLDSRWNGGQIIIFISWSFCDDAVNVAGVGARNKLHLYLHRFNAECITANMISLSFIPVGAMRRLSYVHESNLEEYKEEQ